MIRFCSDSDLIGPLAEVFGWMWLLPPVMPGDCGQRLVQSPAPAAFAKIAGRFFLNSAQYRR